MTRRSPSIIVRRDDLRPRHMTDAELLADAARQAAKWQESKMRPPKGKRTG